MIIDFDPNEAETDKQNPYHGMLTLTIQGKGVDSHTPATPRGPGRPPLNDIPIEELTETDDPVCQTDYVFLRKFLPNKSLTTPSSSISYNSVVNKIEFNASAHNLPFKPFVHILAEI